MLLAIISAFVETLLYVILPSYILYRLLILLVANPLITYGFLYPAERRDVVKGYLLTTVVFLLIGGLQTFFLYWIPIERGITVWNILLAIVAAWLWVHQRYRDKERQRIYVVEIGINGQHVCLNAIHDTGNFLRDPFTGKMVNVIDADCLKNVAICAENLRYIPYNTVGKEHGLMQVLTVDKMTISQGDRKIEKIQPVIGLAQQKLFLKQDIQMILHSEMI